MASEMGMSMKSRKELTATVARRYRGSTRSQKSQMLDEFCLSTGFTRSYAATLLRGHAMRGNRPHAHNGVRKGKRAAGGRPAIYDKRVERAVRVLWRKFGYLCGKRLAPLIRASIEVIANDAFLSLSEQTCAALRQINPATIDRMLKPERARMSLRGTGYTKARGGLWDMIPVRTFGEWQQVDPGHVQTATVGHDGGFGSADCAFSLCLTDVCLGWTERRALKNRAARWVIEALDQIIENMPFTLLHLHPDNGSEFINHNLKRYCDEHRIALTRSRPERKNDNCYVEQKNFDTIRKLVGYARYSSDEALQALNELYFVDGLLHNYFLPSQKLISKTRTGSRVQKRYDAPRSPAERLLEDPPIPESVKRQVYEMRSKMHPLELAEQVRGLQNKVLELSDQFFRSRREAAS